MKISTEIASASRIVGEEKAIELIAKAGFDAWDFSMFSMCRYDHEKQDTIPGKSPLASKDYLAFARKLKQIGSDFGIHCNQSHAPFPSAVNGMFPYLERAIECTAEAGGKICVIHPNNNFTPEQNAEMYGKLLPLAKSCGVKIATENMWNWKPGESHSCFAACATAESFYAHMTTINDEDFVACLDIGHAEMQGSGDGAAHMIRTLGHFLQALHIHDNDRVNDSHQIPFSMNVDFQEVANALKDIRYPGYLTLEADAYLRKYNEDNVLDGLKDMAQAARKLEKMIVE